ncbi:hypothetical protein DAPPUDRAFT_245843 [Daphnia pulex]|uniref:Tryptophan synthase beta chain-like PALP domain-containing protein n=1 Tax=Daphnia pulex TaxID=6669 RepID=E9GP55_DAPPU|nr:hypothetical protein DAPPUDRAFT_245843 [Daphnia pulex]|eukprot:EFX78738.1 hypothetical protein DAPPUDRAFT_245843 [Daphnia pulex]
MYIAGGSERFYERRDREILARADQGVRRFWGVANPPVLAKLLEIFLKKKGQEKRVKILVGTAGDTGPASAHSVANLERVDLVLLYPLNRVSKIQELQMLTVKAPNLREVPTMGTNPSKNVSKTSTSQRLTCCPNIGDEICIVVPTGAAGNLAAGFLTREMGFPIKLVATAPYNIERVLYFATHGDALAVRNVMQDLEQSGKVTLSAEILAAIQDVIVESVSMSDSDIVQAMQLCHSKYNYVLVCLATASASPASSPAKFPEACDSQALKRQD